jgi:hypothetical protein
MDSLTTTLAYYPTLKVAVIHPPPCKPYVEIEPVPPLVPPRNAKVFPLEALCFTELTTIPEDPDRWMMLCRVSVDIGIVYRLPRE